MTEILELVVGQVRPARDNPRRQVGDTSDLAASIRAVGILAPLVVVADGTPENQAPCVECGHDAHREGAKWIHNVGKYDHPARPGVVFTVVDGHRRLVAAAEAGLATVPVIVRELDEQARLEAMLIANLHREDLSPVEEAKGFARLVSEFGYTQERVAERIGRGQQHVSRRLALLRLPTDVLSEVHAGGVKLREAEELARLEPDRITRALSARKQGATLSFAIDKELTDQRWREERDALVTDLTERGVEIVDEPDDGWWHAPKGGPQLLSPASPLAHVIPLEHESEACHAVSIDNYNRLLPVCTRPERHPGPKDDEQETDQAEEDRRRKERTEALTEARRFRIEVIAGLVQRRVSHVVMNDVMARAVLALGSDAEDLARVLGFEPPADAEDRWDWSEKAVEGFADKGPDELVRAGFAAALLALENMVGFDRTTTEYLEFLERHGHRISDAERAEYLTEEPAAS